MIKLRTPTPDAATLADLLKRLGDVPPERIRLFARAGKRRG
jgi:hypothetical protein